MKRNVLIAGALGAILAGPAVAAEPAGGYAGAVLGSTKFTIDGVSGSSNKFTWGLMGGYRFNEYAAVELGYYKPKSYVYDDGFDYIRLSNKTPAISLLVGTPFGESFSGYVRVGAARPKVSVYWDDGTTILTGSDTSSELVYGAGLSANFSQASVRVEWTRIDSEGLNGSLISAGLVWSFGQ